MPRRLWHYFLSAILFFSMAAVSGCSGDEIEVDNREPVQVSLADPKLSWSVPSLEVVYGEEYSRPSLSTPNDVDVVYSSSDKDVATISEDGSITILSSGTTTISATSGKTDKYEAGSAVFTLVVKKAPDGLEWSEEEAMVVMGQEFEPPTLLNPNNSEIDWSSSDESVAVIAEDGAITILGAGITTISATSKETPTHEAGNVSFSLSVSKNPSGISWSEKNCQVKIGEENTFPTLDNPGEQEITYSSSDETIASISPEGEVILLAPGTVTIIANASESPTHNEGSAIYTLEVAAKDVALVDPGMSWPVESLEIQVKADDPFPVLDNPNNVEVTYTSSSPSVATISPDGNVVILSTGMTTITASSKATDVFMAGSVSYTLTVTKSVPTLSWSSSSCEVSLDSGDGLPALELPEDVEVTFSSSNTSVATIDSRGEVTLVGGGYTTITATSVANEIYVSNAVSYRLSVSKIPAVLSWSAEECAAALDGSNLFPTLDNPRDLTITYSSSNTSVAKVSPTGEISLSGKGTAIITASFKGNNSYLAASTSFTLNVSKSLTDDGAGTFTFPSTGDAASDDDISNTTFNRMITIRFEKGGTAKVTGDFHDYVSVRGNIVTVNNTSEDDLVVYKLTGSTNNGYFKLYSEKKQAILLSDLDLTNFSGSAINIQSGKRTFVMLEGTNMLSDDSGAAYSSNEEDMKAVLYSEGQLVFGGNGSLTVNAENRKGKSGIHSDDYVRFMPGPRITITAGNGAGHGIKGKDYVMISGGTLSVSTAAAMRKGIISDDYVWVEGGETTINVSGGVKFDQEEREFKGTAGIKADNYFVMTGGTVDITNTGDGGKGIRAGSWEVAQSFKTTGETRVTGGVLNITTEGSSSNDVAAKGIKIGTKKDGSVPSVFGNMAGDGYRDFYLTGGKVTVNTRRGEALEVKGKIIISGGEHCLYSKKEDAINSKKDIEVTGGYLFAWSDGNDAIDSNADFRISGGIVYAVTTIGAPEVALDAMLEKNNKLYIEEGATVISFGGMEPGAELIQPCYKMDVSPGGYNALLDDDGNVLAVFKAPENVSRMVVSAPSFNTGLYGITVEGGTTRCKGNLLFPTSIKGGEISTLSEYVPVSIWDPNNSN